MIIPSLEDQIRHIYELLPVKKTFGKDNMENVIDCYETNIEVCQRRYKGADLTRYTEELKKIQEVYRK